MIIGTVIQVGWFLATFYLVFYVLLAIKGDTLGVNMAEYVLGTSPSQRESLSRRIPHRFVGFFVTCVRLLRNS